MSDNTLMLRQVHPDFIQQGCVTSQAFRPTPKDQGKLSVYDGDQVTPEQSWIHYKQLLHGKSDGVVAVTVLECGQQGTKAYVDGVGFQEHAVIDFTDLPTNSKVKSASKQLTKRANDRGWLLGPIN